MWFSSFIADCTSSSERNQRYVWCGHIVWHWGRQDICHWTPCQPNRTWVGWNQDSVMCCVWWGFSWGCCSEKHLWFLLAGTWPDCPHSSNRGSSHLCHPAAPVCARKCLELCWTRVEFCWGRWRRCQGGYLDWSRLLSEAHDCRHRMSPGLVAQRTIFGWILSGVLRENLSHFSEASVSHQLLCCDVSDSLMRRFWDLESIGILDHKKPQPGDAVLSKFHEQVQFSDGRYSVALPWKENFERSRLLSNEDLAKGRLKRLSQRLSKDPAMESRYHEVIQDMECNGVIEEVPVDQLNVSRPIFYMPHRPVVKESSMTRKVRPVFDAFAKGRNNVSLNDNLETGPNLLPDLLGILLRFRRWKVALCANIKAFLQIEVHRDDRDVHRFLWDGHGIIKPPVLWRSCQRICMWTTGSQAVMTTRRPVIWPK